MMSAFREARADEIVMISFGPYTPQCVERLYEKASSVSQSPQHEANHGSVHENASLVADNFS
jgi:hypothetical protein